MNATGLESGSAPSRRWHDLDALRGFAMLLGIGLHAALAFIPSFWPVQDRTASTDGWFDEFLVGVHAFRMPLFFLLSGFFTAMLWRRRGLAALVSHRARRVALPLLVGLVTIIPAMDWVSERAAERGIADYATAAAEKGDIWLPIWLGQHDAIAVSVANGADVDERSETRDTPLHLAAFLDQPEATKSLLDLGADYRLRNKDDADPLTVAIWIGSDSVADQLVAAGAADRRDVGEQWSDLAWFGSGAEFRQMILEPAVEDDTGLESWIDQFHHLWFLWFLCWMVAGFVVVAPAVESLGQSITSVRARRRLLWLAFPLTLLLQYRMEGVAGEPAFGPDTSTGLWPALHVILYYAVFFGYGAALYGARTDDDEPLVDRLGRHWMLVLPVTVLLVFPLALLTTNEWADRDAGVVLQAVFCWGMVFGLIGLFRRLLAKPRAWVRWLSDSSYWMYLAHLPLVILAQDLTRSWDLPATAKFLMVCWTVTAVLFVAYRWVVRPSPIGWMLNGRLPRAVPDPNAPTSAVAPAPTGG